MDYVEAFKNLKTNNKWGRKSPHKAVLMLTVIDLFEKNLLTDNEIRYDETLKSTFLNVWNKVLPDESFFQSEAYLPFWYLQSDSFWHIVPIRGKEDIVSLMRDTNIKPSEAKLKDSVKYAELDEDLYFLMTLPSGRSSLKRALLESYTTLSEKQIDRLAVSKDNAIDYSTTALSDYEKILSKEKDEDKIISAEVDKELVSQFLCLKEDIQLALNIAYFTFLKKHYNEREMFKEVCPTVYDLLDKIVNHPIRQGDIAPSFAFVYDNFLSDLKVSLLSEDGSLELIDKVREAITILRGNNYENVNVINKEEKQSILPVGYSEKGENPFEKKVLSSDDFEIEHFYLDNREKDVNNISIITEEQNNTSESRRGKTWTVDEEKLITLYFQQGKDFLTIASLLGRSEIAIKTRLAKLGLIEYTYGQDDFSLAHKIKETRSQTDESEIFIKNSSGRASIFDKYGERVFITDGQLKYLNNKLYRLNLKRECFTLKGMFFDGSEWKKGTKIIVAYPNSDLYRKLLDSADYCEEVEDIVDSSNYVDCKLKVKGIWFNYKGNTISDTPAKNKIVDNYTSQNSEASKLKNSPLYAVRKQAILRAMDHFKLPVNILDITKAISRTAWRTIIKAEDVEEIITTMSEIIAVDGKYVLRKKL